MEDYLYDQEYPTFGETYEEYPYGEYGYARQSQTKYTRSTTRSGSPKRSPRSRSTSPERDHIVQTGRGGAAGVYGGMGGVARRRRSSSPSNFKDENGRCREANGQFAPQGECKGLRARQGYARSRSRSSSQGRSRSRSSSQGRSRSRSPGRKGAFMDETGRCHKANGQFTPKKKCARSQSRGRRAQGEDYARGYASGYARGRSASARASPRKGGEFMDMNGRCRESNGQFAPQGMCWGSSGYARSRSRSASPARAGAFVDVAGRCHEATGQFAPKQECARQRAGAEQGYCRKPAKKLVCKKTYKIIDTYDAHAIGFPCKQFDIETAKKWALDNGYHCPKKVWVTEGDYHWLKHPEHESYHTAHHKTLDNGVLLLVGYNRENIPTTGPLANAVFGSNSLTNGVL